MKGRSGRLAVLALGALLGCSRGATPADPNLVERATNSEPEPAEVDTYVRSMPRQPVRPVEIERERSRPHPGVGDGPYVRYRGEIVRMRELSPRRR